MRHGLERAREVRGRQPRVFSSTHSQCGSWSEESSRLLTCPACILPFTLGIWHVISLATRRELVVSTWTPTAFSSNRQKNSHCKRASIKWLIICSRPVEHDISVVKDFARKTLLTRSRHNLDLTNFDAIRQMGSIPTQTQCCAPWLFRTAAD